MSVGSELIKSGGAGVAGAGSGIVIGRPKVAR
jgi:hypothetical protein